MYRYTDLTELMVWHKKHRSEHGVMRLPVDSPTHKHVELTWPEFERDPKHVRLGLASMVLVHIHLEEREDLPLFGQLLS